VQSEVSIDLSNCFDTHFLGDSYSPHALAAEPAVDWISSVIGLYFSICELLADFQQFLAAFVGRLWIAHLKTFECIKDDLGYDQPSVLFVVGRNDIPGRVPSARRTEAFLIRLHIVLPEFPLRDVRETELPVLFRLVDTRQETLALLFLREMEVDLHYASSVDMEMSLQIRDRTIPVVPNRLVVVRDGFAVENLGMSSDDQHLLVIGSVEDADPPALR